MLPEGETGCASGNDGHRGLLRETRGLPGWSGVGRGTTEVVRGGERGEIAEASGVASGGARGEIAEASGVASGGARGEIAGRTASSGCEAGWLPGERLGS
jgi:hypothetical protein